MSVRSAEQAPMPLLRALALGRTRSSRLSGREEWARSCRAHGPRLAREVAIKVIREADPERLRRFVDEARAAGALNARSRRLNARLENGAPSQPSLETGKNRGLRGHRLVILVHVSAKWTR